MWPRVNGIFLFGSLQKDEWPMFSLQCFCFLLYSTFPQFVHTFLFFTTNVKWPNEIIKSVPIETLKYSQYSQYFYEYLSVGLKYEFEVPKLGKRKINNLPNILIILLPTLTFTRKSCAPSNLILSWNLRRKARWKHFFFIFSLLASFPPNCQWLSCWLFPPLPLFFLPPLSPSFLPSVLFNPSSSFLFALSLFLFLPPSYFHIFIPSGCQLILLVAPFFLPSRLSVHHTSWSTFFRVFPKSCFPTKKNHTRIKEKQGEILLFSVSPESKNLQLPKAYLPQNTKSSKKSD